MWGGGGTGGGRSASSAIFPASARAIRVFHHSSTAGSAIMGNLNDVSSSVSERSLRWLRMAISCTMAPPIEWPRRW